jgi:uncharacterized membrane protein
MNVQTLPSGDPVNWLLRGKGRFLASAVIGGALVLATPLLPTETRIVLGFDLFALTFVTLVGVLMSTATPEQCAILAMERTPAGLRVLLGSVVTTMVSIAAIAAMLHSQSEKGSWLKLTHLGGSMLALLLCWIASQMIFGLHYMRIYYRAREATGGASAQMLEFPSRPEPDLWDFMYYSFTIGMCYQTSDVDIIGVRIRRLTLLHSIYSFLFVAAIIGFFVNVLSNIA